MISNCRAMVRKDIEEDCIICLLIRFAYWLKMLSWRDDALNCINFKT